MHRRDFIRIASTLMVLGFVPRRLLAMDVQVPGHSGQNFRYIYFNRQLRDAFYPFLQNVYTIYPDPQMQNLIIELTKSNSSDEEVYKELQHRLPEIEPYLGIITYSLPTLTKQKKEMARQAHVLLASTKSANGYLEVGTTGRYLHGIKSTVNLDGPVYVLNYSAPQSFSFEDIAERGQIATVGNYISLNNYAGITNTEIPPQSLDLVTNFIGFHHAPPERRDHFMESVRDVLRPGGRLLLRDHDATNDSLKGIVALAHDVFNAGLGASWETNYAETRNFVSVAEIEDRLERMGLRRQGPLLLQDGDPTRNTLMLFERA